MLLTKATIISWSVDPFGIQALNDERLTKLTDMQSQGKTDLSYEEVNPTVFKRFWIDAASAQEYVDFMMSLDTKYGPGLITGTQIIDVNITI